MHGEFCFLTLWDEGEFFSLKLFGRFHPMSSSNDFPTSFEFWNGNRQKEWYPKTPIISRYLQKSSDNLISCTPLVVCSMGFLWGNSIQGEPGYSPGGLPGGLS